jgi:uncharacterized DUF497 family protein
MEATANESVSMHVEFDEAKRQWTLIHRGLDFRETAQIFADAHFTQEDDRYDYPEPRYQTYGRIDGRLVMIAWTPTLRGIRVISMRKCNDREQKAFATRLG